MSRIAEEMAARSGRTATPSGLIVNAVKETIDFRRVRDLPRRDWAASETLDDLIDTLTAWLKTPKGVERLRPIQAATLSELHALRGAFVPSRVGAGKTLIGGLAPVVLDAQRPMYVTRGGVEADTRQALYDISNNWRIAPLTLTSYSKLAKDYENEIIGKLQPDLIVCDESDALASTKTGCWQILKDYIYAKRAEERAQGLPFGSLLVFVPMCGTPTDQSLKQYAHSLRAALGPERSPIPKDWREENGWAFALDEKVTPESRWQPGALPRLDPEAGGETELERARNAYGSRFRSTPGIMTTGDARPSNELHLRAVELEADPKVAAMIVQMRATRKTPDDHPFETAMERWRHCREMQCDFYNVWDPRPPAEWLAVRKDWHQWRDENFGPQHKYRTPGHLVQAILAGDVKDEGYWSAWKAIEPTFVPNPVPVFVSDKTTLACIEWLEREQGLLWVEFPALGRRISELTDIPYYHQKGLDSKGNRISAHKPGMPAIASVKGCSYGLNLQRIFHKNYYSSPMSTNKIWEQSLGRTHRDGQPEPVVSAEIAMMVTESYSSMVYAIRKAEMVEQTMKQVQKLAYADVRDLSKIEALIGRRDDQLWIAEIEAI